MGLEVADAARLRGQPRQQLGQHDVLVQVGRAAGVVAVLVGEHRRRQATRAPPTQTPRGTGSPSTDAEAQQIGAQARRDPAAVVEPRRPRRRRGDAWRCPAAMSPAACPSRTAPEQQARRRIVRGQDVEQPRLGQRRRRDVAGMRAAAQQVRRPHHHRDALRAAGRRRLGGGRELGDPRPVAGRGRHLRRGRVVVAGERRAEPPRRRDRRRLVPRAVARARSAASRRDVRLELRLGHARGGRSHSRELGDVGELPLARGVVHQADDADPVLGAELGELLDQRLRAGLGAQVQPVADAQRCRRACSRLISRGERPGVRAVAGLAAADAASRPAARRRPW